ncbi:hypothetical protein [Microvirga lotononidis]|uniref:Uncharacterized protein n=1 Tax=Microvirga lotononidis TaxID=864069 RepID=I4YVN5_9HYPH|nr:hypothetical protein [Microvirga lotononidis]EIM28027.1 hypothetical protein MicloDRAFT_00046040 [Microvirga lotononidis]WQO27862.1 hypothetical protein U0023_01755 [Microvirga lotononidis]
MICLIDPGVAPHEFDCNLSWGMRDDIPANSVRDWSIQHQVFFLLLTFNFNVTDPSRATFETWPTASDLPSKRKAGTSSDRDQVNEASGILPTKGCTVGDKLIKNGIRLKAGTDIHCSSHF